MHVRHAIDQPTAESPHYRQRIPVEGWIFADDRHPQLSRISLQTTFGEIGSTRFFFVRPDVCRALDLPPTVATGFRLLAVLPPSAAGLALPLEIRAEFADGSIVPISKVTIRVLPRDFTDLAYGNLANPEKTGQLQRKHIHSVGNPAEQASPECVDLLTDYLPPNASVMDAGCGIGAYCDPLQSRGFAWVGCEIDPLSLRRLARDGRPHRAIRRRLLPWLPDRLPAHDGEFDAAIAVEVLEHVLRPEPFLRELKRIARTRVLLSVPNMETLPFLADRLVAPWHILASDHVNFYSRFNLRELLERHFRRVEIVDYGRQPLNSPDDLPLPYHLFAVCEI